jgi:hypothetical protein
MSSNSVTVTGYVPLITASGKEFIVDDEGLVYYFYVGNNTLSTSILNTIEVISGGDFYVCDDNFTDFYYITDTDVLHNGIETNAGGNVKIIYADKKCYVLGNTGYGVIEDDKCKLIENNTGLNVGFIGIDERTGFGYCAKKFGKFFVCPYCEDTSLNYPNDMYYQIISFILAVMFKSKQNADTSALNAQLAMAEQTFEETLGSDSFQFPRMGNVYN